MTTQAFSTSFIAIYVLTGVNIVGTLLVLISLFRLHQKRTFTCHTYLLSILYGTLFFESIFLVPFLWKSNHILCQVIENFEAYVSLMSIIVVGLLVEVHCSYISEESKYFHDFILEFGHYVVFGLPLIVFLGNFNDTYTGTEAAFCATSVHFENVLSLFIYFIWVWFILFYCIGRSIYTVINLYRIDTKLAKRFFTTMSLYIVISIYCWLSRTVFLIPVADSTVDDSDDNVGPNSIYFACFGPIQVCTFLFCLLYLKERRGLRIFEQAGQAPSGERGFSFSWEQLVSEQGFRNTEMMNRDTFAGFGNPSIVHSRSLSNTSNPMFHNSGTSK